MTGTKFLDLGGARAEQRPGNSRDDENRLSNPPRFAVIVPAYNEADNIPALFGALRSTFDKHGLDGEVIIVDDGSTDATFELAIEEAARFGPRARVARHRRNLGKTEGMVTGSQRLMC